MHHTVQAVTTYVYNALMCTTEWAGRVNTNTQMAACIMASGMNMVIAMDMATWCSLMATTTGVSLTMGCIVALGSWSSRMGQGYCFFLFITVLHVHSNTLVSVVIASFCFERHLMRTQPVH